MTSRTIVSSHENTIWSPATIMYISLSFVLMILFWWSITHPFSRNEVNNKRLLTVIIASYLLFGMIVVMLCSYNNKTAISWLITIIALLSPVLFSLFWLFYRNYEMVTVE